MKKTLLFLFLFCGVNLSAQNQKTFTPHSEISFGYGALGLTPTLNLGSAYPGYDGCLPYPSYFFSGDKYLSALSYRGNTFITGNASISYMYNFLSWIALGGTFSHTSHLQNVYNRGDGAIVGNQNDRSSSIIGTIKFSFVNREWMSLYSKIGIGVGLYSQNTFYLNETYSNIEPFFAGQITLVGLTIGKKVYGFGEILGFGVTGFISGGIGYRF